MTLTRQRLLFDLYVAFYDARRGKSKRSYVVKWERNMKVNMERLCDDLYNRTYEPMPSKCFVIDYPKKREIFAAMFRDRIVHHLYFNYTHEIFERTFIADSYSCIKGRGTHYGINRIRDFCRRESENWQQKCYAMHLDIRGYFMHINRQKLLDIATQSISQMATHRVTKGRGERWGDVRDIDFVLWLTRLIVTIDPRKNCEIVGDPENWDGLDPAKSMLHLEDGLGLPIGNLTSQLFSNVYLNAFDQYMKRTLKCRYYGRYVDDACVVSNDREWLLSLVPEIRDYLHRQLSIDLHMGKVCISEVHQGVEFLGAFIKPWRVYISNHSLRRIRRKIKTLDFSKPWKVVRSINSYLGIFHHTDSWKIRRRLLITPQIIRYCIFDEGMNKATDRMIYYRHFFQQ